jgi:hypothetical protein
MCPSGHMHLSPLVPVPEFYKCIAGRGESEFFVEGS